MSKIDRLRQRLAVTGMPDDFDEREDDLNERVGLPRKKKKRHTKEDQQYSEIKPSLDKINNMSPDEIANLRKHTPSVEQIDETINALKNRTPEEVYHDEMDTDWTKDVYTLSKDEYKKKYGGRRRAPSYYLKEKKLKKKGLWIGKLRQRISKFSDWKPKKGKYPVVHPEKYSTGGDLLDRISAVRDYKKGLFTPEDEIKMYSQLIKYGMPRSRMNQKNIPGIEGFAQGADATIRTGVISSAGEINWEQFEDLVGQMEKGLGEGKTVDEIAETAVVKKVRPSKPTDKDRGDVMEARLRQRIAKVRVAVAYRRKIGEVMKAFNEWKYNKNGEVTNPLFTKLKGGRRGVRFLGNTFQYSGHYTKSNTDLPLDKTDTKFTPHNIMRKTPKGMVIDNYGYDSESTWRYMNMAGISTQAKGSDFLVGGKKYNPEQGGKMLVPWANISDSPIPTKNRGRGSVRPHQREFERQTKLDYSNSPTGVPLDPTRIQPDDQQTINEILGTNRKGPKRVIRGVKAHHPIGYATGDVGKHSKRGVPLSNKAHFEAEHPEKTVIGYKGTQKYDFKNARLKIARMRQRIISRGVTQINMAKEDYDPVQAWATMIRDLKGKPAHQLAGNWTYLDGDLVDFDRPGSKEALMKSVKGNPKQSIFTVSNTHGIKDLFDKKGVVNPELQKKYDQLTSLKIGRTTIGKWEDEYDATVNFRDIDNKKAEEIARGVAGVDVPQKAYIETFLNQKGEPESKFHSYNEKTDTYE